ncbi:hypothetical protein BpHYR1_010070 [Brachionus plicatilis]|uniref:Uncharacterized protein n=1 Tax=Brachionus plicatilis TaxID=10195 RepID=A0A3M7P749_BRAPC|nr:hypothetical protein BpHYR1_010070 [Brachionus plicatilis]
MDIIIIVKLTSIEGERVKKKLIDSVIVSSFFDFFSCNMASAICSSAGENNRSMKLMRQEGFCSIFGLCFQVCLQVIFRIQDPFLSANFSLCILKN